MGLFDFLKNKKNSNKTQEEILQEQFNLKKDPFEYTEYTVVNKVICFKNLRVENLLTIGCSFDGVNNVICSWEAFHLFETGLVMGWGANEKMVEFSDSLKKGAVPDYLKNADKKALEEIKQYKPPENFEKIKKIFESMTEEEIKKIKDIRLKFKDAESIKQVAEVSLLQLLTTIAIQRLNNRSKEKEITNLEEIIVKNPGFSFDLTNRRIYGYESEEKNPQKILVATFEKLTYQRPFAYADDEKIDKLARIFILREEMTVEHAKLILPTAKEFLYGTIMNNPNLRTNSPEGGTPKETLEIIIEYFKRYIRLLEKVVQENKTAKIRYF